MPMQRSFFCAQSFHSTTHAHKVAHCPTTSNTKPLYSSNQHYMLQAVNYLDLTSLPAITQTCFWISLFLAVPVRATSASGSRGLCCSTPPKPGHFLCSHLGLTCFPLCSLSALFLTLAACPGHITAHREMQVQRDEVLDVALRQQQMQCQVPWGFHNCRKRPINQRGFIKEPGEPLKNLEVCLRVRDFRS